MKTAVRAVFLLNVDGANQRHRTGGTRTLSSVASLDVDPVVLTYDWMKTGGRSLSMSSQNGESGTSTPGQKLLLIVGVSLLVVSLLKVAFPCRTNPPGQLRELREYCERRCWMVLPMTQANGIAAGVDS